jgi:hypothetical protein
VPARTASFQIPLESLMTSDRSGKHAEVRTCQSTCSARGPAGGSRRTGGDISRGVGPHPPCGT